MKVSTYFKLDEAYAGRVRFVKSFDKLNQKYYRWFKEQCGKHYKENKKCITDFEVRCIR